MEADQIGFSVGGVHQASAGEVAIAGINVIQVDVLGGRGDHATAGDFIFGQQEQRAVAHEILYIVKAELVLNGDVGRADILVHVQDVGEAHNRGGGAVHLLKLVFDAPLGHRQRHLIGGLGGGQGTFVQVGVEAIGNQRLQLIQEFVVCLLNGVIIAVIMDRLDGNSLGVLFNGKFRVVLFLDSKFGIRDGFALADGAGLQRALSILGFQHRAGGLTDGAHNAHDLAQMFPVSGKTGYEIDLTRGYVDIIGFNQIIGSSHYLFSFLEHFDIFGDGLLPLACVLDFHDFISGHGAAAAAVWGVELIRAAIVDRAKQPGVRIAQRL